MSFREWSLLFGISVIGLLQYGLMIYAIRDIKRRPRVRGDNKMLWALFVLIVPFFGALIYSVAGPTSFLPRSGRPPRRPLDWQRLDPGEVTLAGEGAAESPVEPAAPRPKLLRSPIKPWARAEPLDGEPAVAEREAAPARRPS